MRKLISTLFLLSFVFPLFAIVTQGIASPQKVQEQALMDEANPFIDKVLDPATDKTTRIDALRKLKGIRERMKALADEDPDFDERDDLDEFKNIYEEMSEFLSEQAEELGINLNEPPSKAPAKQAGNQNCPAIPMPDYSGYPDRNERVADVDKAYNALKKHLKSSKGENFQDRAKWTNDRDRLLEALVKAQIALVWEAAGAPPPLERVNLLRAKDKFLESLEEKRDADAEEQKLMVRLAELHRQFNKGKEEFVRGGKTPPSLMQLDAEARRVIKKIMALRRVSNQAYREYLEVVEPLEKAARKMFDEQLKNGVRNINFKLGQQGHEDRQFELFRPRTKHERELLNGIIGEWLIQQLGIIGAREGSEWVDWDKFKDFDFDTAGAADGECSPPKEAPKTSEDDSEESTSSAEEEQPKTKRVCKGGGLLGAMNCVTIRIDEM